MSRTSLLLSCVMASINSFDTRLKDIFLCIFFFFCLRKNSNETEDVLGNEDFFIFAVKLLGM